MTPITPVVCIVFSNIPICTQYNPDITPMGTYIPTRVGSNAHLGHAVVGRSPAVRLDLVGFRV